MDIVAEVREILIAAKPANQNRVPCRCAARPVPQKGVDELLAKLNAFKPVGRTYERRAAGGRMVLHPAPWVRSMLNDQP